jgi:hypothetical protein
MAAEQQSDCSEAPFGRKCLTNKKGGSSQKIKYEALFGRTALKGAIFI